MAAPIFANIPDALKLRPQWVCWRLEVREGDEKPTKRPYNAKTGRLAHPDKPGTWGEYDRCVQAWESSQRSKGGIPYSGIGYFFHPDDPFASIDIDRCIDADTGEIAAWADVIISRLASYAEVSQSGKGIHIICEGVKPGRKVVGGGMEFYDAWHYLAITGNRYPGSPAAVNDRRDVYTAIYNETFPAVAPAPSGHAARPGSLASLDDNTVLEAMLGARKGSATQDLWIGGSGGFTHNEADAASPGAPDWSRGDLALCNQLAFYCRGDVGQIARLMRASGRTRARWDRRVSGTSNYLDWTIAKAMQGRTDFYTPPRARGAARSPSGLRQAPTSTTDRSSDVVDVQAAVSGGGGGTNDDVERLESLGASDALPPDGNELPAVQTTNRHMREQIRDTHGHLVAANEPPAIFVRSMGLVRVNMDPEGAPIMQAHDVNTLRDRVKEVCKYTRTNDKGHEVAAAINDKILTTYLAAPGWRDYPVLSRIVGAPVFCANGDLIVTPGYHAGSRTYYHPAGRIDLGDVSPTGANVRHSVHFLLNDMLGDFPFADEASKAHALCCLLLPFIRDMVKGPTPLHLFDAPAAGTGKTLLAEVITKVFDPTGGGMKPAPTEEDEWEKVITALLDKGVSHIFFDNARRLDSQSLMSALTAPYWTGRLLGGSKMVTVPVTPVWIASCNNLQSGDEIIRRSIWIRLDAGVERPESRTGFRIANIREWVETHRSKLITCALTICNAWIAAKKPPYSGKSAPMGSFEAWFRAMGGVLECAEVPGFAENRDLLRTRASTQDSAWYAFIDAWRAKFPGGASQPVTSTELFETAQAHLSDQLGDGSDRSQKTRLGKQLSAKIDRIFGGWRLCRSGVGTSGTSKNVALYHLEALPSRVETTDEPGPPSSQIEGDMSDVGEVAPLPPHATPSLPYYKEIGDLYTTHIYGAGDSVSHVFDVSQDLGDELD